jgi:hypothetical protein
MLSIEVRVGLILFRLMTNSPIAEMRMALSSGSARATRTPRKSASEGQACSYACKAYTIKEKALVHNMGEGASVPVPYYSSATSMMAEFPPRIVERINKTQNAFCAGMLLRERQRSPQAD